MATDTTPAPTDAEIEALAAQHLDAVHQFGRLWLEGEVEFARAVLARWGAQPAASPAPVVAREPLTDEQIRRAIMSFKNANDLLGVNHIHVARAIEAAHSITSKEGGPNAD